jgi:hypothetical protein
MLEQPGIAREVKRGMENRGQLAWPLSAIFVYFNNSKKSASRQWGSVQRILLYSLEGGERYMINA